MNSRTTVAGTIALTYLALMVTSGLNVLDPFLRHDDYPALLAAPSGYYEKTLYEGRWLNYWWHLRRIVTPSWLNFAAYQLFWAAFCAATAVVACGRDAPRRYVLPLALMIALAVPSLAISNWFNTLLPGVGIVALYALLATRLSLRTMRLLLLVFVPITLTSYTTYPLMLLSVCVVAQREDRSWKDLSALVALFAVSFALGMLMIYTLNLIEHGVFGVQMAEWRNPNPARDLASIVTNLKTAVESLANMARLSALDMLPVMLMHGVLFVAAMLVLSKQDPWSVPYILTGIGVGVGLLGLHVVLSGIALPERVATFAWLLYAVALVRALMLSHTHELKAERWLLLGFQVIVLSHLGIAAKYSYSFVAWQRETRAFAAQAGSGEGPIYIVGDYNVLDSARAAFIQHPRGLRLRLYYLTGRWAIDCSETPKDCPEIAAYEGPFPHVSQQDDYTVLYLPPAPHTK